MKLQPDKFMLALARKGLTIRKLAELSGVKEITIHRIKSKKGSRNNRASPKTLGQLAIVLEVDVLEISNIK